MLGASPRLHQHQDMCKVSKVFLSKMFLSKTWSDDLATCVFQNCLWWLRLRLFVDHFFFLNVHYFECQSANSNLHFLFLICRCVSGVNLDLSNQPDLLVGQFWGCQSNASYLWVIKIACPLSFFLPGPNERTAVQLVTPKIQFCGSYGNRTGSTGLYQYQLPTKSRRWNEKQLNSVHGYSPVQLACAASSIIDLVLISFRCVSLSSSAVKGKRCTRKAQ